MYQQKGLLIRKQPFFSVCKLAEYTSVYCLPHSLLAVILSSADSVTFVNSLDLDQDRQNIGPDLIQSHLTL